MEERHQDFAGTIPENYERQFVPMIFAEYAEMLADNVACENGENILEIACGTGAVTRNIAKRMNNGSRTVATDINEAMLEVASNMLGNSKVVDFQLADATVLPFEDEEFDAVVCQFGVMYFPERLTAYRETARVLKPAGKFHFNVWGSLEENHFAQTIDAAARNMYPEDPPKFFELPYGYCDISLITDELQRSGFSDVQISECTLTSSVSSARHLAMAFCKGSPLGSEIAARDTYSIDEAVDQLETAVRARYGDGPISAPIQAFQISAQVS